MARKYILVSGSRHYRNYFEFARKMDKVISRFNKEEVILVEGGELGVDTLTFIYALRRGILCTTFKADWDKNGKGAGFIRNDEMLAIATHCITFWDGVSKGTKHIVDNVHHYPISYRTVKIPVKDMKNEKPRRRNKSCRQHDGRTLSRIRKRHAHSTGFGSS